MKIGDNAPDITLDATSDKRINLDALRGNKFVVYFYPKDNTPGCTTESQDFRDLYPRFIANGCQVFGVSRDSLRTHENFKKKHEFPFELISDPDEALCQAFDVIKLKKLYGKEYLGIERSSFLFDEHGVLTQEWRKVRVKGHAEAVLEAVTSA